MLNTNTNAFKEKVWSYLEDCITDDNGDNFESRNDAFIYLRERFTDEYCFAQNMTRYPNEQDRLKEWLAGLAINIDYTYTDIVKVAEGWHESSLAESQQDKVIENWFNFLAFKINQFWRKEGI